MSTSDNRRSVRFAEHVNAASTITLTKTVEQDATVEKLTVRIYRGAELALQLEPFVKRDGREFALVEHQGKQYIDGDGDFFEFPVSESVETDDEVGVRVTNEAADYGYSFALDVVLDREGGTARSLTSFIGGLF